MPRRRQIYEGKGKLLFEGPEPGTLVQHFKDDVSAFDNQKRGTIVGKGVINNRISEFLMLKLAEIGIPTHLVRRLNMREQLVREVEMIPLEVTVCNVAAGVLSQRLGIPEGTVLPRSIIEYYYKNDRLGDPLVSEEHITAFGWASTREIDEIVQIALRVNDFLTGYFMAVNIRLIDCKLEFGRLHGDDETRIVIADEISPDNCRLWDSKTNEKMDKDRFRRDLGKVEEAYQEVARRLGIPEGTRLPRSIIESYYKNDALNDPMVSEEHITAFGWAAPQELDDIMALAIRVNDFLTGLFLGVGIRLVDFKIECGRLWEGDNMRIVVADEISPDSCRLWDIKTNDKMDKDRFRKDLGGMIEAYTEVARRLGVMQENETLRTGTPKLVK